MRRREFITLLGGAAVAWPRVARTQQSAVRHIGILAPYSEGNAEYGSYIAALRQELARLGWTDGRNIQYDERWTTDNMDLVRNNAASLMASKPDVVVAFGGRVIPILLQNSRTIPIVAPGAADPVGVGWGTSLARPGGNLTGFPRVGLCLF